eukprot:TRINITY_DN104794_c0_g1_i1.p1 TRINITY_DN104794_c0_g1~~TRINITY_DN104794_c0_g1_i1.p1  ORF type:complete len:348 (-),score=17.58 TRINITY_DN104794_c0_g1_i1:157-1200(-)
MSLVEKEQGKQGEDHTTPFVQKEVYGNEVRECFLNRPDMLHLRISYLDNSNVFNHYSRGRPDFLKAYSSTVDGFSDKTELEFYKRPGRIVKYQHEVTKSKGAKNWRFSCWYENEGTADPVITRHIQLVRDAQFNAESDTPSDFKGKIQLVTEDLQPSESQPYSRIVHDFLDESVTVHLWPLGAFSTQYTGDMDIDIHNQAVHSFRGGGVTTSVERDPTNPSQEDLADEYEWVLRREQQVLREVLDLERWLYVFGQGESTSEEGGASTMDPYQHWYNLERTIRHLFDVIDRCDVRASAGEYKEQNFDKMEALHQQQIATLEQQIRDKDRLIKTLTDRMSESDKEWLKN